MSSLNTLSLIDLCYGVSSIILSLAKNIRTHVIGDISVVALTIVPSFCHSGKDEPFYIKVMSVLYYTEANPKRFYLSEVKLMYVTQGIKSNLKQTPYTYFPLLLTLLPTT